MKAKTPFIVFLAERLADEARLDYVKDQIRFDKKFFVQRINKGGDLVLFWKDDINIDVKSSSLNHIDVTVNKNSRLDINHGIFFVIYTIKTSYPSFAPKILMRSPSNLRS